MLLFVDEVEIERYFPWREIVELSQTSIAVQFHLLQLLLQIQLQFFSGEQSPYQNSLPDLLPLLRSELREGRRNEQVVKDKGGDEFLKVEHQLVDQSLRVLGDRLVL